VGGGVVENGFDESTNTMNWSNAQLKALRETRVKYKAALLIMYQVVDESSFEKIESAKFSNEAWDIFEKAYKEDEKAGEASAASNTQGRVGEHEVEGDKKSS